MIFNGGESRLWFAAVYLSDPWRAPVAVAFILLGAAMLTLGVTIPIRHERAQKTATTGQPERVLENV
ncbi:hypothetical protein CLV67_12711 [Actinoplanes italicus]|uniref:Uncharacterized protein n=2 Tax=Actinoplanes italicus TaxID=113567 RepID=A0A2T0JX57_9ACTN|nr:hypothetical protein CLV67_12711 [Actinoplanes italicus]